MQNRKREWKEEGNWKLVSPDGDVYLKVINFPVPEGSDVAGESMWVRRVSGDDLEGTGILDNKPFFCDEVGLGDLIRYRGGTHSTKPSYVEKVIRD